VGKLREEAEIYMIVKTLIDYLRFFDSNLEVRVCQRTRAKLPLIDPWKTEEAIVEVPLLCAPTAPIDIVVRDKNTPGAPVLVVI